MAATGLWIQCYVLMCAYVASGNINVFSQHGEWQEDG